MELRENQLENGGAVTELRKMSSRSKTKTLHKGKKANTKYTENELVEWILMSWLLNIPVTSWEVIIKTCSLKEESKTKKCKYITKLVLQIFEEKHAEFQFKYSCWTKQLESYPELIRMFIKLN